MNKKKELAKNTFIIALGKMSTQLIAFLLLSLYTFFLTPAEYGAVDLIVTYITLLVPALTLQLEMAAFRFLIDARGDEKAKKRVVSSILQTVVLVSFACILLFAIVEMFIDIPYASLILLAGIATIFSNLFLQMARGLGSNTKFAIASIATGIATLVATIGFIVIAQMGAEGMLLSIGVANTICALYLFFALRLYEYTSLQTDRPLQKELIQYSFPLVPNGISWWVINVSDRTIIAVLIGLAANGIYAVANKYAAIFTSIFGIFAMSWAESASMHIDSKDRDRFFSETINASVRLFGSLGLVLIAALPLVFGLLIDVKYNEAYLYVPILIIAAFFNALVGLYSAIYIAKKMTKQVANTSMVAAAINIGLTLVLIHSLGLYAAAIATAVAYLVMTIYRHYDVKKYVKISYEKNIFVLLTLAYVITTVLYYTNNVWVNVANALLMVTIAILLNKPITKIVKDKVFSLVGRKKKLNLEQEIYKELP